MSEKKKKTLEVPLMLAITKSKCAEAWTSTSCWQIYPRFVQLFQIFFSFLCKINPFSSETWGVARQPEGEKERACKREKEKEREGWRGAWEQKWGISSCCPSGPCTDTKLRSTHTHKCYTQTVTHIRTPHTDWKLVEGHDKTTSPTAEYSSTLLRGH